MVESLLVEAVLIAVVGFVESNAIAKAYALEHSYEVSSNRELVALGTANFISVSAPARKCPPFTNTNVLYHLVLLRGLSCLRFPLSI